MPAAPEWQYGAIAYLLQADQYTTLDEQQQHLGCTPSQLKWLRSKLIKEGKIRSRKSRWNTNQDEDIIDGLRSGLTLHKVSKRVGRTPRAVKERAAALGGIHDIRTGDDAVQTISATRSATQIAKLLGVSWVLIKWLLTDEKALKFNRASYTQPKGRIRNWQYFISDDGLMEFLDDRRYWMLINPMDINDPDWREYAHQVRREYHQSQIDSGVISFDTPQGEWVAASNLAERLGYTVRQGSYWCRKGLIPALRVRDVWYVWTADPEVIAFWYARTIKPLVCQ